MGTLRFPRVLPLLIPALAAPAKAGELELPFPILALTTVAPVRDSYALPVAPWSDGHLPVRRFEGIVLRRAWQLDAADVPLLAVIAPLREQLRADGYTIVLDCKAQECGGFDFRFATEVMDEPAMHVDLGEFRFLSATRSESATAILVSRSAAAVFVQIITVTPADDTKAPAAGDGADAPGDDAAPGGHANTGEAAAGALGPEGADDPGTASLTRRLDGGYAVTLEGMDFESGSAVLSGDDDGAAAALAAWLAADRSRRILLVGHTDASGTLDANIALSKRRAEAVRQVLIGRFGADGARIMAAGAGPMAPRDTNATEAGRLRNRRVEAVPLLP